MVMSATAINCCSLKHISVVGIDAESVECVVAQHASTVVSGNLYNLPLSTDTIFFCNGQCPTPWL